MEPTRPAGRLMMLEKYLITLNIAMQLGNAARSRGCRVFASDVKLRAADRVYYPDVILACGKGAEVVPVHSKSIRHCAG
jgi:hypothetical protein